jgi:DNA-directed RNA polymerase specialized sigma24 family protein
MADSDHFPPAHGDEADLFRAFNDDLMQSIDRSVRDTTPQTIEDACAFAWTEFMRHQPSRERNWQGWLFRVAQREAWRLERGRLDHNKHEFNPLHDVEIVDDGVSPLEEIEIRNDVKDALTIVSKLPPRLQRVALLRALGHTYRQIAELTGVSTGRAHKIGVQVDDQIRELLAERARLRGHLSPRAERLWELEQRPPEWLLEKIGPQVKLSRKVAGRPVQQRAWRRAALALDDYRRVAGAEGFETMTTDPPASPALRAPHAAATKALDEFYGLRERERDQERSRER